MTSARERAMALALQRWQRQAAGLPVFDLEDVRRAIESYSSPEDALEAVKALVEVGTSLGFINRQRPNLERLGFRDSGFSVEIHGKTRAIEHGYFGTRPGTPEFYLEHQMQTPEPVIEQIVGHGPEGFRVEYQDARTGEPITAEQASVLNAKSETAGGDNG